MATPLIGILMGSTSDWEVMKQAAKVLVARSETQVDAELIRDGCTGGKLIERTNRQVRVRRGVVVVGQRDLLQVVAALHAGGRLANLLHGRQQQADQDRDDGDDHQQLDQRKRRSLFHPTKHGNLLGGKRKTRKTEERGSVLTARYGKHYRIWVVRRAATRRPHAMSNGEPRNIDFTTTSEPLPLRGALASESHSAGPRQVIRSSI